MTQPQGTQSVKRAAPRLVRRATSTRPPIPVVGHEQIALRAHELFEQQGREHGHDLDHWFTAERELRERGNRAVGDGLLTARPVRKRTRGPSEA